MRPRPGVRREARDRHPRRSSRRCRLACWERLWRV